MKYRKPVGTSKSGTGKKSSPHGRRDPADFLVQLPTDRIGRPFSKPGPQFA
jgi:hypothetical protein